jgi:hypothetical protein
MTTPRLRNGRKLHYLGRGYMVLLDASKEEREVSNRAEGGVWIGFSGNVARVIFLPDETGDDGLAHLTAIGASLVGAMVLHDDGIVHTYQLSRTAYKGDAIDITWVGPLAEMA